MPTLQELLGDPTHGLVREVRHSQLRMATAIEETLRDGGLYVVEGPVGLGKSFAYLLPILLAGKRAVISTPKKSLQDQLVHKDIPALLQATGIVAPFVVVKGKGNYACRERAMKLTGKNPGAEYLRWIETSRHGDRADYPGMPPAWFGKATAETCTGRACPSYASCGYIRMRQEAQQAKIIVINHHLLGSDFYYGLGKMVGGVYETLVIDEAHKLQDGIRAAFTLAVGERSAHDIIDLILNTGWHIRNADNLGALWDRLFEPVQNKHWRDPHERKPNVFDPDRAAETQEHLEALSKELTEILGVGDDGESHLDPDIAVPLEQAKRKVDELRSGIATMQGTPCGDDLEGNERWLKNTVIYAQGGPGGFTTYAAPVNLAAIIEPRLLQIPAKVMTSATLAVGGEFNHLRATLGDAMTRSEVLPPSFDYGKQGVLYVPNHLPFMSRPKQGDEEGLEMYEAYLKAIAEECAFLVNLSGGNAFILTTANDEMQRIVSILRPLTKCPVLMQTVRNKDGSMVGEGEPQPLLRRYMQTEGAVLVGSKSFWEGVDVQGEKLLLVIIVKLPFPGRNDPVMQARRRVTENSFLNVDCVEMLTDLRQGTGRLIRSATDRGVVAILDSRAAPKSKAKKGYGRMAIKALPFPQNVVTHERQDVEWYLPRVRTYFKKLNAPG